MMKVNRLLPLVIGGAIFLYSCGKDDEAKVQPKAEFPTEYSEKTVAENKEGLESNGIELMNNITDLKNSKSIQTSMAFSSFFTASSEGTTAEPGQRVLETNKAVDFMKILSSFGKGKTSMTNVLTNLRTTEDTVESIQRVFDENKGIFSYDATTGEWSHNATGEQIVYQFPSAATGTSNNAIFTISEYKGVQISNSLNEDYYGDYPTSLKANLTVDGATVLSYSFAASYHSNGDPSSVSTSLTMDNFKLSAEVKNTVTDASANYSFSIGDKNLFSFGASAKGNFDSKAGQDAEDVGSVLTSGNAYFQILNIKFSGESNAKALETALKNASNENDTLVAINDNFNLIVYYEDSKKKIADSEFYMATRTYQDDFTGVTRTEREADIRLIFADGSKSDLETYTETGFEDIQKQYEEFITDVDDDM